MSGLTKFLFGEKSYNHNVATFHQTEHAEDLIYEGPLYHHTGLRWKTAHWRLLWQDSKKKEQAVLVRYAERTSSVPVPGAKNVVLLSSIKTLVPIEKHEVEPRYSVTQTKASRAKAAVQRQNASGRGMSAAMAAKNSAPTKYRFALETLDGSTWMLAAPSVQERFDWLGALNTTLIKQAAAGFHSDPSVLAEVQAAMKQLDHARDRRREIEEAMARPIGSSDGSSSQMESGGGGGGGGGRRSSGGGQQQ